MDIPSRIKQPLITLIEWIYAKKKSHYSRKQYQSISRNFLDDATHKSSVHHEDDCCFLQDMSVFVYKDESWNYIKNLAVYREQMQQGHLLEFEDNVCSNEEKYTIRDGTITIDAPLKNDNWLCFLTKQQRFSNFSLAFDIEIYSEFTEIQVAFRYADLGNRYRFMIRDNREAVFECVHSGEFYHSIRKQPFSLKFATKYRITVRAKNEHFQFFVNDMCVFSLREKKPLTRGTDIGLIFWNIDNQRPIKCKISNISLKEVETGNE